MAVVGIFAFNFTTTLPLLATRTFHGGAGTYSALLAAMGAGAVIGGLVVAHRSRPSTAMLSLIGLAFGVMLLVVAAAPTEVVALVVLVFMGLCSISFISTANATIQLQADPAMRGRVMALYAIAFLGSTPIGAPLVGWIADISNPRIAVMVGGVATLAACIPLALRYRQGGRMSEATLGVKLEISDAEPGEVVDFAPQPIIDARSRGDQARIRPVGDERKRKQPIDRDRRHRVRA
jgi:MFS family permease